MVLPVFSETVKFKHEFATTGIGSLRQWYAKIMYQRKWQRQLCKDMLNYWMANKALHKMET